MRCCELPYVTAEGGCRLRATLATLLFIKVGMLNKLCAFGCKINLVNREKVPVFYQLKNEVFGRRVSEKKKIFLYVINTLQISFWTKIMSVWLWWKYYKPVPTLHTDEILNITALLQFTELLHNSENFIAQDLSRWKIMQCSKRMQLHEFKRCYRSLDKSYHCWKIQYERK